MKQKFRDEPANVQLVIALNSVEDGHTGLCDDRGWIYRLWVSVCSVLVMDVDAVRSCGGCDQAKPREGSAKKISTTAVTAPTDLQPYAYSTWHTTP